MKQFQLRSYRNIVLLGLFTFADFSFATESIDCIGETYSIQIHCGSENCGSFSLYKDSTLQDMAAWKIQKLQVNFQLQTIALIANDIKNEKNSIYLSTTGKEGKLSIYSLNNILNCDWSAFVP